MNCEISNQFLKYDQSDKIIFILHSNIIILMDDIFYQLINKIV